MSLVHNEQTKITAAYLNTAASAFFAAGVVAPLAAFIVGVTGPSSSVSMLTLLLGVTIFLAVSIGLHLAARYVLKGLRS